jgi:hypothetical protein
MKEVIAESRKDAHPKCAPFLLEQGCSRCLRPWDSLPSYLQPIPRTCMVSSLGPATPDTR